MNKMFEKIKKYIADNYPDQIKIIDTGSDPEKYSITENGMKVKSGDAIYHFTLEIQGKQISISFIENEDIAKKFEKKLNDYNIIL